MGCDDDFFPDLKSRGLGSGKGHIDPESLKMGGQNNARLLTTRTTLVTLEHPATPKSQTPLDPAF